MIRLAEGGIVWASRFCALYGDFGCENFGPAGPRMISQTIPLAVKIFPWRSFPLFRKMSENCQEVEPGRNNQPQSCPGFCPVQDVPPPEVVQGSCPFGGRYETHMRWIPHRGDCRQRTDRGNGRATSAAVTSAHVFWDMETVRPDPRGSAGWTPLGPK